MTLLETISKNLNIPLSMLESAILHARDSVTHFEIPKRDGSTRRVYQPSKKTKTIQYWLISNIFNSLQVHDCAMAYQKNKSIKLNAKAHQTNRYFLKLDFKNFFPSIKFIDFAPYIKKWNNSQKVPFEENELLNIINKSCFYYKNNLLPIGFPTSPVISNIIMYEFDVKITASLSIEEDFGKAVYTRYADDLTFSTNTKGACRKIKKLMNISLKEMISPNLQLNPSKTKFVSSSSGSSFVTGLRICHDGHITIHRKYKDKIRLLLSLYNKDQLDEEGISSLKGHMSYVRDVDGSFYTKMQKKHFVVINKLLNEISP